MAEQVAGGVSITFVKKAGDVAAVMPFAPASCTLEDITVATAFILNLQSGLKKTYTGEVHFWDIRAVMTSETNHLNKNRYIT